MRNRVVIQRYHPVLIDIKLFILGITWNSSIVDVTRQFFTVSDNVGIKFNTHSDAENYCRNQEYEWEDA